MSSEDSQNVKESYFDSYGDGKAAIDGLLDRILPVYIRSMQRSDDRKQYLTGHVSGRRSYDA